MQSPALKTARIVVFLEELGWGTFNICSVNLKLPWPLSPPNFSHISLAGIAPSCHVNPVDDL